CGFALVPLLRVRRVAPSATLRDGISEETSRWAWLRPWPVYLLLIALLVSLAVLNSANWKRAFSMTGGLLVAFVMLAATAKALAWTARKSIRASWPYLLRQGLSNLYRPRNQTLLFLLSLGLGTFLLLTILLTRNLLLDRLAVQDFATSPNLYLVDVQPDQVDGVAQIVTDTGLTVLESAPMITMRIKSVKGVPIREIRRTTDTPRWVLQREYRSTYRDKLTKSETLIAGELATTAEDPLGTVPVSLEEEIAGDLDVKLGDEIVLDVQGVPITAKVTSIRKVDWSQFNLNFFMVFPPGVLEGAPGFHVLTTRVPDGSSSGELQRKLVQEFTNVSAIDLTLILETVRNILSKVELVVQILASFTLVAGLLILTGTLLNGRDQRVKESVLLRTLGASGGQVRWIFIIEYAALGGLSALSGVVLAAGANAALAIFLFEGSPWPDPVLLGTALVGSSVLAVVAGLMLSRGVCTHPPLEILRSNG
ncbi:MAG: ABC transporter permease, partial [Chthoniobacteraceae bacterium]